MKRRKIFLSKKEINELQTKADKQLEETPLEKNDFLAMTLAGLLTLLPAVLIVLALFFLLGWIFTGGY